jgi:hypothetical protein
MLTFADLAGIPSAEWPGSTARIFMLSSICRVLPVVASDPGVHALRQTRESIAGARAIDLSPGSDDMANAVSRELLPIVDHFSGTTIDDADDYWSSTHFAMLALESFVRNVQGSVAFADQEEVLGTVSMHVYDAIADVALESLFADGVFAFLGGDPREQTVLAQGEIAAQLADFEMLQGLPAQDAITNMLERSRAVGANMATIAESVRPSWKASRSAGHEPKDESK